MWKRRPERSPRSRFTRLELESLEERLVLDGAVRYFSGDVPEFLASGDDNSSPETSLGFEVDFFGVSLSSLFVNNNGNITFGASSSTFTPEDLTTVERQIIAPFYADVDTRHSLSDGGNTVTYDQVTVDGRPAFHATWNEVGYFSRETDKLNTFQVVLISRVDTGFGNFDIEFNYDQIQWEAGDASGGSGGLGGSTARVGYANGTATLGTFFELAGSAIDGALLDSNTETGLIHHSLNSTVEGRYVFQVRNGTINRPPNFINLPAEVNAAQGSFPVDAADPDGDTLTYHLVNPLEGMTIDENGVIQFGIQRIPGRFEVGVQVTDGINTVVQSTLTVNVFNFAPRFNNLPNEITVFQNAELVFDVDAFDPENDTLFFRLFDGETEDEIVLANVTTTALEATIDADGVIRFTPTEPGLVVLTVIVEDEFGNRSQADLTITVVNQAPTITNLPGTLTVDEGGFGSFDVLATDPENDLLTYSILASPVEAIINPTTGRLQFAADNGPDSFTITVAVRDGNGNQTLGQLLVAVRNVAPTFDPGPDAALDRGEPLQRTILFADPGLDVWTITIKYGDGLVESFVIDSLLASSDGDESPVSELMLEQELRSFPLAHTYGADGVYRVSITIEDGADFTTHLFDVTVLPNQDLVDLIVNRQVAPGETAVFEAITGSGEKKAEIQFVNEGAGEAAEVLFALYNDNPTPLPRAAEFFDLNVRNGTADARLVLTFSPSDIGKVYEVGFFDEESGLWQKLDAVVLVDPATGELIIEFPDITLLHSTVFAVSVASPVRQGGPVTGPTVQAPTTNTTDSQAALSQSVTFLTQTQLSVGFTASQIRQSSPAGVSQGVTGSAGSGGPGRAASGSSADEKSKTGGSGSDEESKTERKAWWALWNKGEDPFPGEKPNKGKPAVEDQPKAPKLPKEGLGEEDDTTNQSSEETPPERQGDEESQTPESSDDRPIVIPEMVIPLEAPAVDSVFSGPTLGVLAGLPLLGLSHELHRKRRTRYRHPRRV